ncbi:MAG: YgcG family protein [Brevinematales bacterium]|nr:YgcG family protein [Brevinematales bacterium]
MLKKFFGLLIFSVAFSFNIPQTPEGRVNDYTSTLSKNFIQKLEAKLEAFELKTQNQIVVVLIESLEGEDIESFSMKLAEKWKIGKKNMDNGVILTIAMKERKIRIEVGYGLEDKLTDAFSSDIIRNTIAPSFKEKNYEKGIEEGIDRIISIISPELNENIDNTTEIVKIKKIFKLTSIIIFTLFLIFIIDVLRYSFGTSKNFYHFLEWFLLFSITIIILKILFYALMYGRGGYTVGSGGFRSGSGGFSGGGGRFGGGGASGGW